MSAHPDDKLAALQWAIEQAEKSELTLVRLNVLPALRELRDDAKKEAGR